MWTGLALVVLSSFAVLAYFGREVYQLAPLVPPRVLTPAEAILFALFTGSDSVEDLAGVPRDTVETVH